MLYCKNNEIKKGSIIINTLLIGSLILTISLYILKLEFEENKNVKSMKRYVEKIDIDQENKEYLLTDFNAMIYNKSKEEGLAVDRASVKDLLTRRSAEFLLWHNNSYIIYNKDKDCIITYSYFDEYYHEENFYNYSVDNGIVKCNYTNTVYALGKVKQ